MGSEMCIRDSPKDESSYYALTVREGDTLRDIANSRLGSAGFWSVLCEYNDMPDPYTNKDGSAFKAGDTIRIPHENPYLRQSMLSPTQDMSQDVYGKDLYIDPSTGDLEVFGDGNDVRTVTDKENLEQSIRHRLLTHNGEVPFFSQYGIPMFVGHKTTAQTLGYVASHLNHQLLRDPRVLELDSLRISDEGDQLTAYIEVLPIRGSAVSVISSI